MNVIETLRRWHGKGGYVGSDDFDDVLDWLSNGEKVDESFDEGGRWSNYKNTVYKMVEGEQVKYFQLWREVPASEVQEGGDFMFGLHEVEPIEVTVTQWEVVGSE
jgi:hypothetical protein